MCQVEIKICRACDSFESVFVELDEPITIY
jgi:hypothetical protein